MTTYRFTYCCEDCEPQHAHGELVHVRRSQDPGLMTGQCDHCKELVPTLLTYRH